MHVLRWDGLSPDEVVCVLRLGGVCDTTLRWLGTLSPEEVVCVTPH